STSPPVAFVSSRSAAPRGLHSFPTRRSSDLVCGAAFAAAYTFWSPAAAAPGKPVKAATWADVKPILAEHCVSCHTVGGVAPTVRSEEHTSELQSLRHLVCRLLLEKKKERS